MPEAKSKAMPKFTRAPEEMVRLFANALKDFPMAEQRKMFGYPVAFANGQLFAGLFQDRMLLRLPESERDQFVKQYKTEHFEPIPGRPMREYVMVPPSIVKSPAKLRTWLGKGLAYAQSLPPKVKRKTRARPKR